MDAVTQRTKLDLLARSTIFAELRQKCGGVEIMKGEVVGDGLEYQKSRCCVERRGEVIRLQTKVGNNGIGGKARRVCLFCQDST